MRLDIVQLLLQFGAKPGVPCDTVVQGGWTTNANGVSHKQVYPLEKAVEVENMGMIEVLLTAGAQLNQCHKGIQGLLMLATKHVSMAMIRWLYQRLRDDEGLWHVDWSEPLMLAVKLGNIQLAALLIMMTNKNSSDPASSTYTYAANQTTATTATFPCFSCGQDDQQEQHQ